MSLHWLTDPDGQFLKTIHSSNVFSIKTDGEISSKFNVLQISKIFGSLVRQYMWEFKKATTIIINPHSD